jgi:hypothetical protein
MHYLSKDVSSKFAINSSIKADYLIVKSGGKAIMAAVDQEGEKMKSALLKRNLFNNNGCVILINELINLLNEVYSH